MTTADAGGAPPPPGTFRSIRPGRESLPGGYRLPRHRHLHAYALVVVAGSFQQVSYAGRVIARPGDLLLQPTLDCHANVLLSGGAQVLRLPWTRVPGLGGVHRLRDLDALVRLAERDIAEATAVAQAEVRARPPLPGSAHDWPDLLAADLGGRDVGRLGDWARAQGLALETVSRGFARAYGIGPAAFRGELRAREAWLRIAYTDDGLSAIAYATGFADQAHMTRAIRRLTGAPPSAWRRSRPGAPNATPA